MKKIVRYSVATLAVIVVLLTVASYYMLDFSLCPDPNKGRRIEASYEEMFQRYPVLKPWVDSLRTVDALQNTYIVNEQGVRLHALYIQAAQPTNNTAVIVHGYTDNAIRMLMIGYLYSHDLNYNILLPDLYGHGESGGVEIQMGWKDRLDVLQWMEQANEMFGGDTRMVVHGISMGAATTMMVSGEVEHSSKPYPYVKCFVEDCGYTSVWDEFSHELSQQFHLSDFPLLYTTSLLCRLRYGWTFGEASPLEQVKKCSLPMLFIHGDADTYVPTWMVHPLYEAKSEPKEIWITPGVAHALSYRDYPHEYTERVKNFVGKYIY